MRKKHFGPFSRQRERLLYGPSIPLLLTLFLIGGCQQLPIKLASKQEGCLNQFSSTPSRNANIFHADASGQTLNEATTNARASLAQMISSTISAETTQIVAEHNGKTTEKNRTAVVVVSKNIPINQHRIDETCKSENLYYARASLTKKALITSATAQSKEVEERIRRTLHQANKASPYARYLAKSSLQPDITEIRSLSMLLKQYAPTTPNSTAKSWTTEAERFVAANHNLHIYLSASQLLSPLLPILETTLAEAELDYSKRESKNAAIGISLVETHTKSRAGRRYITNLDSKVLVRRLDTGELLATIALGKQTGTSSLSYQSALNSALKNISQPLKRQLLGDKEAIRKKFGIL